MTATSNFVPYDCPVNDIKFTTPSRKSRSKDGYTWLKINRNLIIEYSKYVDAKPIIATAISFGHPCMN